MRIAIDLQGIQSEGSRTRGIGRYSLEIIKNIITLYPQHQILLVANAALSDLQDEFSNQLNLPNVNFIKWYSPAPFDFMSRNNTKKKLAKYLRSYTFSCLHADIILITSFFEGFSDNCLIELDKDFIHIPIISIFYDLIPLLNPNLYLNTNPDFSKFYKAKIRALKDIDGLLAISYSSAKEAINYLEFEPNNIYNISSACDVKIFNDSSEINSQLEFKLDVNIKFILYSGASDPRKNIRSLLHAFSLLPEELKHLKLVLVGHLLTPEIELIDNWINFFNIDSANVIKTGYISDFDLVNLYRSCELFVFPSLHEGFGLPVLEAMSCGAPVIGSNCTSIPEVIGFKEAMFDPSDINDIKNLIIKALTNIQFKKELRLNSIVQSKKFSWTNTSNSTIEACRNFINSEEKIYFSKDWKNLTKINYSFFELLIQKIKSLKENNFFFNKKLDFETAASIDKITIQLDSIARNLATYENLSWRVEGPFDSSYSLSILNRCFTKSLHKKIFNLSLKITEGLGDYDPNINYLMQYSTIYSIFKESKNKTTDSDVISRNLYPPRVNDMRGTFNLLHSYGWEESEFPAEWINEFNCYLQGITVMSSQVKKILIDNGLNLPVKVSGLGLDHMNEVQASTDFKVVAKKYKILHISSCFPRKGIDILLNAYSNSFTNSDDVSLIIKTFDNPHNNVNELIEELKRTNAYLPDIIVIKDELTPEQIKSLYLQSDVLVSPSRGEGFGLPIAEAMLLGVPVITTNWGGQVDFCNQNNSWLIDYEFVLSESHFNLDLSYYAEPSIDHLSLLLKEVYNLSSTVIEEKLSNAQKEIKNLKWDTVAEKNIDFVRNKLCNHEYQATKIGWISTWHSNCGIASYSRRLTKFMPDDLIIFSPLDENSSDHSLNVIPCWELKGSQKFDLVLTKILSAHITSLVIQFNYGLFDFDQLSTFIQKCIDHNINIIFFLHSTIDPPEDKNKSLQLLVNSFKKCKRIFVHTVHDLNRLKNIGLINNVSLFPHGIIDSDINLAKPFTLFPNWIKRRNLSIVSYGFCLPNKGFLELVKSINILRNHDINLELNIYSSIYNQDYYWVYEKLKNLICHLNLGNLVNIHSEYIEENQVVDVLSKHDLVVLPYQSSNESSSAAVRDALASLRPVMVTPLPIFDDVSSFVDYLPGISPADLADGLKSWYLAEIERPLDLHKFQDQRLNQLKHRRFSSLSYRISNVINGLEKN